MILSQLQTGDLVRARGRDWIVLDKPSGSAGDRDAWLRVRPLSGSEEDAVTIVPALEREPALRGQLGDLFRHFDVAAEQDHAAEIELPSQRSQFHRNGCARHAANQKLSNVAPRR